MTQKGRYRKATAGKRYPKAADGMNIKRVREAAGMTPSECAAGLGIDTSSLWRIEVGENTADRKLVLAFVAVIAHHTKSKGTARAIEEVWKDVTGAPWGEDPAESAEPSEES